MKRDLEFYAIGYKLLLISDLCNAESLTLKVLTSEEELIDNFRLRYRVYQPLGYLPQENAALLDIDEFDRFSVPIGIISHKTGSVVASIRVVTTEIQTHYANLIEKIADRENLKENILKTPEQPFPSIAGYSKDECDLEQALMLFNTKNEKVAELSRFIVDPEYRGTGIHRILGAFGIAWQVHNGMPIGVAACNTKNFRGYSKFGYKKYPGIEACFNNKVKEMSYPLVANFGDVDALPGLTGKHVKLILEEFSKGAHALVLNIAAETRGIPQSNAA